GATRDHEIRWNVEIGNALNAAMRDIHLLVPYLLRRRWTGILLLFERGIDKWNVLALYMYSEYRSLLKCSEPQNLALPQLACSGRRGLLGVYSFMSSLLFLRMPLYSEFSFD